MSNGEIIQLIFSGIVTLSTVVYSILTWQLVKETRIMREFQNTPDVNVFFDLAETDASLRYIIFTNTGLGIARDVKFKVLKNFGYYSDKQFSVIDLGIIQNGLSSFYPKQKFRYLFTDLSQGFYETAINDPLIVEIIYKSISGKTYNKTVELLLKETHGNGVITPPDSYIGKISYELKELRLFLKNFLKK